MTLEVPLNLTHRLKELAVARGQSEPVVFEQILTEALVPVPRRSWVGLGESGIGDLSKAGG
jgi:predicted transcriptional regulator